MILIIGLIIATAVLLSAASVLGFFLWKASQRLLEFDDLYELLVHDLDTNIAYFEKLTNTPLLSNSPEILEAQKNMRIIRDRLNEYVLRMEELTRRKLRKQQPENANPPVVA